MKPTTSDAGLKARTRPRKTGPTAAGQCSKTDTTMNNPLEELLKLRHARAQAELDRIKRDLDALDAKIATARRLADAMQARREQVWPHSSAETKRKAGIE